MQLFWDVSTLDSSVWGEKKQTWWQNNKKSFWMYLLYCRHTVILLDLQRPKLCLSSSQSLSHEPSFKLHVHLSLPRPSVRVSTSSLWAPGQTLLFIFLSKSNESHMHTHANAHFCIYTLTQTPLYLRQSIQAFTPTRSPLQSVARLLFQVPVSLVTLSVLAPPSRHSKAKRRGCQSKQPTCIQTHAHLACLCSHDPYEFTNTVLCLCSCTWLCRSGRITMDSWQSF